MNAALNSYHPDIYVKPVVFKTHVNNTLLTVSIVEEIENPVHFIYKIKFGDGVTLEVFSSENGKFWINDDRYLAYLKAVENELYCFSIVKDNEWSKFEFTHKGKDYLVWVSKFDDEVHGDKYSVYYEGRYQFHLRRLKQSWEARCMRAMDPTVDEELASIISLKIDAE